MPLPTTTAVGPLTLAEGYLAATFAASARCQTMLGVANSAAALARMYIDAMPLPAAVGGNTPDKYTRAQLEALRPYVLIGQPPQANYRRRRVATDTYADSGILTAQFVVNVATGDRLAMSEIFRTFKNNIGVMLTQMDAFAYLPGYLAIDQYQVDGPWRADEDQLNDMGDFMLADITVWWNGGLEQ